MASDVTNSTFLAFHHSTFNVVSSVGLLDLRSTPVVPIIPTDVLVSEG
jgi:hypothetical protein